MSFDGILDIAIKLGALIDLVRLDIDIVRSENKKLQERIEILESKIGNLEFITSRISKYESDIKYSEGIISGFNYNP